MPKEPAPEAATRLYDIPETRGFVNWTEGQAQPGQISLDPPSGWDETPEVAADRQAVADAMAASGAGASLARELWSDITAAAARPVTTTEADGLAELRRVWGNQTEAKLAVARGRIAEMAAKYPGTMDYLNRTGLGNDPAFIRKIVARAGRRR
jgi:hypothetical protein